MSLGPGLVANGGLRRVGLTEAALQDPLQHPQVVAEAGPDEVPLVVGAEPVDVEDPGGLVPQLLTHVQPVLPVVGHVIAAEGEHGHGIPAHHAHRAGGGGGGLRCHDGAHKHAVGPVPGLVDQGGGLGPAAAEHDGGDGHALGVLKLGGDAGAVLGWGGEAGVGMGALLGGRLAVPGAAFPVHRVLRRVLVQALPPYGVVVQVMYALSQSEDGALPGGGQGVGGWTWRWCRGPRRRSRTPDSWPTGGRRGRCAARRCPSPTHQTFQPALR